MPPHLGEQFLEFIEKIIKRSGSDIAREGPILGTIKELSEGEVQMLVDEFRALIQR